MSGAYPHGNYEIFAPQSAKGKYNKYANQLVAIVSITYKKGSGVIKGAKLYLTEAVDKEMGYPKFLKLGTSGSNVGLIPCDVDDGEVYVVTRKKDDNSDNVGMAFVNINAFAKYLDLEEGIYSAHKEPGGVIEFNRKSKPSRA